MKYDQVKAQQWLSLADVYLPGLSKLLREAQSPILIVGASVCDIYQLQDWIPTFRRKTGDVDLSVGLTSHNSTQHQWFKQQLLNLNYTLDAIHPYRFHSPNTLAGAISYLDILADPIAGSSASTQQAQQAMGVSEGFTLNGFSFARKNAFHVFDNVSFPNPIGFFALKRVGYLDEPAKRIKDLADIIEITNGLVEKGTHFEIEDIWNQVKQNQEAQAVRQMLIELSNSESIQWDLDDASNELTRREFSTTDITEIIPRRIKDFAEVLS